MIKPVLAKQQGPDGKYLTMWGWGLRAQALRFNSEQEARDYALGRAPGIVLDFEPMGVELEKGDSSVYAPWAKRA